MPQEDITKFVSQVLLQALKLAIARDNGAVSRRLLNPVQQLEPRSGAWAVHQVVLKLRSVFQQHNILSNKHFPMQFCCILRVSGAPPSSTVQVALPLTPPYLWPSPLSPPYMLQPTHAPPRSA